MGRLTRALEDGRTYAVDDSLLKPGGNGYVGEAIDKLATGNILILLKSYGL